MEKIFRIFLLLLLAIACEDVIEIKVPSEKPRLIIDALIRVDESQENLNVKVKAGLTGSFFGTLPLTGLSDITIINLDRDNTMCANCLILKEQMEGSGVYEAVSSSNFFKDGRLVLQLTHEERLYIATTQYMPSVPIESLEQGDRRLFGDDETEIIVTLNDDADRTNFYVFDFGFNEFLVTEDEFYQGQQFKFSYFYDKTLEPGQKLIVELLGADREFYNYMDLLIEQSDDDFNIFDTPVATVRGNIFDATDIDNISSFDNVQQPDNFPLGYFAVAQVFRDSITIQ